MSKNINATLDARGYRQTKDETVSDGDETSDASASQVVMPGKDKSQKNV